MGSLGVAGVGAVLRTGGAIALVWVLVVFMAGLALAPHMTLAKLLGSPHDVFFPFLEMWMKAPLRHTLPWSCEFRLPPPKSSSFPLPCEHQLAAKARLVGNTHPCLPLLYFPPRNSPCRFLCHGSRGALGAFCCCRDPGGSCLGTGQERWSPWDPARGWNSPLPWGAGREDAAWWCRV